MFRKRSNEKENVKICLNNEILQSTTNQSANDHSESRKSRVPIKTMFGVNNSHSNINRSVSPIRLDIKEEIKNLNNRLVVYINKVHNLEADNERLKSQISIHDTSSRNLNELKSIYQNELDDLRQTLDEISKEKTKYVVENGRFQEEINSLQQQLKEQKQNEKILKAKLEKELQATKRLLEIETVNRVDIENKIITLKDELLFKTQLFDTQLNQMKSSNQNEIENHENKLKDQLINELEQVRKETETKIQELRGQLERESLNQRNEFEAIIERLKREKQSVQEEFDFFKTMSERKDIELAKKIESLEDKIKIQDIKIGDFNNKEKNLISAHKIEIDEKEREIAVMRKQLNESLLNFEQLKNAKILLDQEIATYKHILESEERRLQITPRSISTPDSESRSTESLSHQDGYAYSSTDLSGSYIGNVATTEKADPAPKKRKILASQSEAIELDSGENGSDLSIDIKTTGRSKITVTKKKPDQGFSSNVMNFFSFKKK